MIHCRQSVRRFAAALVATLLFCAASFAAGPKIEKVEFDSAGQKRTYYIFAPDSAKAAPAPLLLLLHGSGHSGEDLLKNWKDLAQKEGIILVGPDSRDPKLWDSSKDSPEYLRDVLIDVMAAHDIDSQRLYVFGHSAGAIYGIQLGLLESKYFAAVAAHAGALKPQEYVLVSSASRKIPIGLWSGLWDELIPTDAVSKTYDELIHAGFPAKFNPIPKHTHDYYAMADIINFSVWNFLKDKRNDSPEFTHYDWAQPRQLAPK
jgi:poly(3-hydroxybutyrate) depolymerase